MATFKIGKMVLRSLFKKPATLMYPVVPRQWQERTRGQIGIEEASCILCGICAKKCPTNAIVVDRAKRTWTIERMACIQCGSCTEVCPKKCLLMENQYTEPGVEKVFHTFDIPEAPKAAPAKPAAAAGGDAATAGGLKCDTEVCIYCGICAKQCPVSAIAVNRAEKKWEFDQATCVSCGVCVEKCPKKCLVIE